MPINHFHKSNELSDHQYALIGKIIVEFSNIDTLLGELLTRVLITPSFIGKSYTDQMSIPKVVEALKNGLKLHRQRYNNKFISESRTKEIKDVMGEISEIQKKRNKFAHHNLGNTSLVEGLKGVSGWKFTGKPPDEMGEEPNHFFMTDEELKNLYESAYKLVNILRTLVSQIKQIDEEFVLRELIKRESINPSTR